MERLTFEEFWNLSEEERGERYQELSDHDKFRVRVSMDITSYEEPFIPCNSCAHRHGLSLACDAFPDGFTKETLRKKIEAPYGECAKGIRFEEKVNALEEI